MPADRGRHRLVGVDLQPDVRCPGRARSAGRPGRRTASPDRDPSRSSVADEPPRRSSTVPWMACGGRLGGSAYVAPAKANVGVADAAGERRHRERAPRDGAVAVRLEQLAAVDTSEARRPPATRSTTARTPGAVQRPSRSGRLTASGIPTVSVPPPAAAPARSGAPLATSSLTGGVVRKICWSKPTMIPPMLCPTDPPFFFVTGSVYRRTGGEPPDGGLEPSRFGRVYVAEP